MFWSQKAVLFCDTVAHRDTLLNQITNYLAGKNMRSLNTRSGLLEDGTPWMIAVAEYLSKVDSDAAWAFVKQAQGLAWIVPPSYAGYGSNNDDGSQIQLIERIDW